MKLKSLLLTFQQKHRLMKFIILAQEAAARKALAEAKVLELANLEKKKALGLL